MTDDEGTASYTYNSVGSLVSVGAGLTGSDPNATTNVASGISYLGFGATKSLSYGNGRRQTLGYSVNRHQLTSVVVDNQNGTDPIISRNYQYTTDLYTTDNDGRIKKITDNLDAPYTTTYSYDQFNRLTKAQATGYYRQYEYDAWGNLTVAYTDDLSRLTYTAYGFAANASGAPATNQLNRATNVINYAPGGTTSFGYDAAGNLTQDGAIAYSYDAASRLKEVGAGGQNVYGYDGDGLRVKAVSNGGAPIYYVKSSVLGQVAMEIEGSQAVLNRAYVYANGKLLAEQTPDGQFYWTHNDHLGSTRKLTNTSGVVVYRAEYDPFGQLLMETGSVSLNSHKFTGYERDWATGLDNANARMFASLRGRFMQSDPVTQGCGGNAPDILAGADKRLPESLNRYNYVVNDPVNRTDPGGYSAFLGDGISNPAPDEILCQLGMLEYCRSSGRSCYYTRAGCLGGGGGQQGGTPCVNTCSLCCTAATLACVSIAGTCTAVALTGYNNATTACLNNAFCDQDNAAYDLEKCQRCQATARNNLAITLGACAGALTICLLSRNWVCNGKATCDPSKPTCKC